MFVGGLEGRCGINEDSGQVLEHLLDVIDKWIKLVKVDMLSQCSPFFVFETFQ